MSILIGCSVIEITEQPIKMLTLFHRLSVNSQNQCCQIGPETAPWAVFRVCGPGKILAGPGADWAGYYIK